MNVLFTLHNGQKVADSDINKSKTPESFANLNSFKDAIKGQLYSPDSLFSHVGTTALNGANNFPSLMIYLCANSSSFVLSNGIFGKSLSGSNEILGLVSK